MESSAYGDSRNVLDPLIDLVDYPAESARAQRAFELS